MIPLKDYYQILGVSRGASGSEIKSAYRRLAKQYHPDLNKGDKGAEEHFKDISEAYSVLSDQKKRKQYDMFGSAGFQGGFDPSQFTGGGWQGGEAPGGFKWYSGTTGGGFEGFGDLGDIFGDLFNMGGFSRAAGRKRPQGGDARAREEPQSANGGDTYTTFEISFEDAIRGMSTKMSIQRADEVDKITVKIPAGVDNGSKIRIKGKGHPGQRGGRPGDLYLNIRVKPHRIFWREGADIYVEVPISVYEAILGGKVEVPTIDGSARMTIPPGTSSGQRFRLKGKGAPILDKKGRTGDQYAVIQIVPPKDMDSETKRLFEDLAKKSPYNPRGTGIKP